MFPESIRAAIATLTLLLCASAAFADDFDIRDGDTVVFLGDSITATRGYGKHIENYTLLTYPDRKVKFINVGIGGDTAAGGLKRLQRDVFDNGATVLTVAFGVNDIGWGMYADDEHRNAYLDAIRGIVKACNERGVRVYICSAACTGGDPDQTENDYLQQMCDDGLKIAQQEGGKTIDVQRAMRNVLRKVWKSNEGRPQAKHDALHKDDTIHLTELGELAMAWAILKGLGAPETPVSSCAVDAKALTATKSDHCAVSDVSLDGDTLSFTRKDNGLPFNNGIFAVQTYRFVPMNELNRYELAVRNLRPGQYTLTVTGKEVGTWTAAQLAEGINIASATPSAWTPGGPWDAQASALQMITDARHKLAGGRSFLAGYVPDSPLNSELKERSGKVDEQLVELQRTAAAAPPYRFQLKRKREPTAVLSPRDYQVFQRQTLNAGNAVVRGTFSNDADAVRMQFEGASDRGALPDGWQDVAVDSNAGTFEQTISLPAGGWYSLKLQLLQNGRVIEEKTVERLGIGEVFVGAGQSNSTNSGQFKTKQTSGMVASFGGESWQLADDPQIGVADGTKGGSYYPALGDRLYEIYKVPVGIAATGFGGTSVNSWQPDQGLYDHFIERVRQLGPGGFRAVLWHQGESDYEMPRDEYFGKLKTVIEASRKDGEWEFPWFVANASYLNADKSGSETVRAAQAQIWKDKLALPGPDTDTLTGDHRDFDGKGVHFSPKGLKAHGLLWAEQVRSLIDATPQQ